MKARLHLLMLIGLLGLITSCQEDYDQSMISPAHEEDFSVSHGSLEMGLQYPRLSKGFTRATLINQVDDPRLPKGTEVGNTVLVRTRDGIYYSLKARELTQLVDIFTPPYNRDRSRRSRWFDVDDEPYKGEGKDFLAKVR